MIRQPDFDHPQKDDSPFDFNLVAMAKQEHKDLKSQATLQGYLRYNEPLQNWHAIEIWWEEQCFAKAVPAIQAIGPQDTENLRLKFTLPPGVRFSPYAYEQLPSILGRYADSYVTDSRQVVGIDVAPARADDLISELNTVYLEDQTEERQRMIEAYWPTPAEGMARCLCADGLDADIAEGDVVYVREIPNMLGHCIVLKNGAPPLVGYHLDRFELLYPYE